jgi:hypothetical protein
VLNLAAFRARRPEFTAIPDATVQAALDDAEARTDADVFGALVNEAHMWLAADILATGPHGREARHKMTGVALPSSYAAKRIELESLCCAAYGNLGEE